MADILPTIESPQDLKALSVEELGQVASEIRSTLCELLGTRSAHFASNMGVVEICLALHSTFDFAKDRLIWDTGHQCYPHKLVTGRFEDFPTIRTKGGLMGYPNPEESEYDLLMTGHAGCSIGTVVGLQTGDDLLRPDEDRHSVAVIGDGAFSSGVVFEALSHGGWLQKNFTIILNDNQMSICPRVGAFGKSLDSVRSGAFYTRLKAETHRVLQNTPLVGKTTERFLTHLKESLKAGLIGGMMFEQLDFQYFGPIDGHNIAEVQKYLKIARKAEGPTVIHTITQKGYGFPPAEEDPTTFHAPAQFVRSENGDLGPAPSSVGQAPKKSNKPPTYTRLAREGILEAMRNDERVCVITAAMAQGNMLEPIRDEFPDRFFDVGICESQAVVFAAGLAKTGMRPIVDIYSTFLQRSYDQIFQEISLQNLPVILMLDRAGLSGPDGPTHHGVFDLTYLRPFPNIAVMTPGDASDMQAMIPLAVEAGKPIALRYPKAPAIDADRTPTPLELGKAEIVRQGEAGLIIACGPLLLEAETAASILAEDGVGPTVVNARFVKPLDLETLIPLIKQASYVVTIEEGMLAGGFGSAVLEAACDAGIRIPPMRRLGFPDLYVEHGERGELLAAHSLTSDGLVAACRELASKI
jgi:1-deoxy-D-xylulose-5-phosphate synthase